ncbi:MAG: hypothetical protein M3336_08925 [Chloroflexota bacterium]|nr:hypothetical protein [Chloroflexota bacterium]
MAAQGTGGALDHPPAHRTRRPSLTTLSNSRTGHRVAYVMVALLLLFTGVLLPFAIGGVFGDVLSPPSDRVYSLLTPVRPAASHLRIHLNVTAIDEAGRTATLLVSGHQVCPGGCTERYQLLLVATAPEGPDSEGLPPSVTVAVPPNAAEVTQTITLPVRGEPIRYPFDDYRFGFGVVMQRILSDGTTQPLPLDQAKERLFLTFQSHAQREVMSAPSRVGPARIPVAGDAYPFLSVDEVTFQRPLYLKVLTVLLVLLVTAASAYAVFMRPLDQIVINVGALVLGIWGVRAVLVGTNSQPGSTAVDLSLSVVILFLLAAITVRALTFLDERSGFHLLRHRRGLTNDGSAAAAASVADASPASTVSNRQME